MVVDKTVEQRLNAWKIRAVFAVLQKLLFPLDETVGYRQRVRRRCERVVAVWTRLREVAVKPRMHVVQLLMHDTRHRQPTLLYNNNNNNVAASGLMMWLHAPYSQLEHQSQRNQWVWLDRTAKGQTVLHWYHGKEENLWLGTSPWSVHAPLTATVSRTSVLGRRMVASCQPQILFHRNSLSNQASCLLVIWSNLVIQIPNRELDSWLQHLLTAVTGF